MDPEACIPPPQSNGETIEEMAGGVIGVVADTLGDHVFQVLVVCSGA